MNEFLWVEVNEVMRFEEVVDGGGINIVEGKFLSEWGMKWMVGEGYIRRVIGK